MALAMGACGFFHPSYLEKWKNSEQYNHFWSLYLMLSFTRRDIPSLPLDFSQIRPLNHPLRRFVYLTKMICDPSLKFLYSKISIEWKESWSSLTKPGALVKLKKKLHRLLPTYTDSYWNYHYFFEKEVSQHFLPLSGGGLKDAILINTCLPLLHEEIIKRADAREVAAFQKFYDYFPSSDASKTKYLIHRFFGDSPKSKLLEQAVYEQGAYQLHKDFCIHYEASCIGCPFVDRYIHSF